MIEFSRNFYDNSEIWQEPAAKSRLLPKNNVVLPPLCLLSFLDLGKYRLQDNKETQQDSRNNIRP